MASLAKPKFQTTAFFAKHRPRRRHDADPGPTSLADDIADGHHNPVHFNCARLSLRVPVDGLRLGRGWRELGPVSCGRSNEQGLELLGAAKSSATIATER